ncbi:O-antigen ligase family protein [bacterium]|nr:O-antigen ligase family protein [bacterium]
MRRATKRQGTSQARNIHALSARILLLMLLALIPLVFTTYTQDRFSYIKLASLQLVIPLLLAMVGLTLGPQLKLLIKGPMVAPALFFIASLFGSVVFAANKPWAARGAVNLLLMFVLLFACHALSSLGLSLKKVLITVVIVGTLVSLLGVIQYYEILGQRRLPDNYGELQTPTTIGHNNFAAAYIIMCIPATISLLVSATAVWVYAALGACLFIQLYYLLISASRGGWIGFVASMLFWGLWAYILPSIARSASGKPRWTRLVVLIAPLLLGVSIVVLLIPSTRRLVTEKVAATFDLSDKPVQFRLLTWRSTLKMIRDEPLGVGFRNFEMRYPEYRSVKEHRITGRFRKVQKTHNEFLQAAAELGAFGFVAFLFFIAAIFKGGFAVAKSAKNQQTRLMSQAVLVGITAMLVHSLFSFPLHLPVTTMMFFIFCGLISGASTPAQYMPAEPAINRKVAIKRTAVVLTLVLVVSILQLTSSEYLADYYRSKGLTLKSKRRFSSALPLFQKASEFCGSDFLNHYLAAVCLRNMGKFDEAIGESLSALECNRNDRHSVFNLGSIYAYKGMPSRAIQRFRQVLAIDPDYLQAYFNMGAVYAQQGRRGLAVTAYENVLRIDPTMTEACHNMVMLLEQMGKQTEARGHLLKCIDSKPDFQLYLDLARVYGELGQIGNAQRTLNDAKTLFRSEKRINEALRKLPK